MTDDHKALVKRLRDVRRHGFGWPDLLQAGDLMDEAADTIEEIARFKAEMVANVPALRETCERYKAALREFADPGPWGSPNVEYFIEWMKATARQALQETGDD